VAGRPIIGNIHGTATGSTRDATSIVMRVRVQIDNRDSAGRALSTTLGPWHYEHPVAPSTHLRNGVQRPTVRLTGTSRFGRVWGQVERQATRGQWTGFLTSSTTIA